MFVLGIDLGTSYVKASVFNTATNQTIATVQYPEIESPILSLNANWAEQDPKIWWENVQEAILKLNTTKLYNPASISAIGIAYQMHGLVCLDKDDQPLRNSIIWCDSRAVEIGNAAFDSIGHDHCLTHLLNSPGNFTASKLAWVKANEPDLYNQIKTILLPGDYIAMQLTGEKSTTVSALSEGIFWDFKNKSLSEAIFNYFGFDKSIIPPIQPVCSIHGKIKQAVAEKLSLPTNVQVTYKAGDQLNNALSLNVLQPGEVAATAGTSGVIYGVTDQLAFDKDSRINSFAHINHTDETNRLGILLCINGAGILNKWIKQTTSDTITYDTMNELASQVPIGSEGLSIFPFGNGAERILNNKMVDAHINGLQFNVHNNAHLYRAAQEGICFAFKYGLNIMKENSMHPTVIKAGRANLFLSDVFVNSFVNTTGIPVEIYNNDGSVGAAIGAAIGFGAYENEREAFANMEPLRIVYPDNTKLYTDLYSRWLEKLHNILK